MSNIVRIPAFTDNYIWLSVDDRGNALVVDPGDARPVIDYLEHRQFNLTDILITHHHQDHIGGVDELTKAYPNVNVFGPATERFPMVTVPCQALDDIEPISGDHSYRVLEVPGHTTDHIAFYSAPNLFIGDTLFSAGCGRLFEGTPQQMLTSLTKLLTLPGDTKIYCAHEYTQANIEFAINVTPYNKQLLSYKQQVEMLRKAGAATIPTILATEKLINPFLRTHQEDVIEGVRKKFDLKEETSQLEIFSKLRAWKDTY